MTPPPSLGDLTGDGRAELVAVSNDGRVALVDPADGEMLDEYRRNGSVFARPTLADTDGDGRDEVYVVYGDGVVVSLVVEP
jgi:hypothetical protein